MAYSEMVKSKITDRLSTYSKKNKVIASVGALIVGSLALVGCTTDNNSEVSASGLAYEGQGCGPNFAVNTAKKILHTQGFDKNDYTIIMNNKKEVDVNEAGQGAFANPANSRAEYFNWLQSNSQSANIYAKHLSDASGDSVEDVMTEEGRTVFIRFNEPTVLPKNTILANGEVVEAGERSNKAGDAVFMYIGSGACNAAIDSKNPNAKKTVIKFKKNSALGRAGCLNPQYEWPIPFTPPKETPKHDNPKPKTTPTPTPTQPTLTPKDPSKDVLKNPNVPDQVKGPGTGVHEPAKKPVDSGNGGAPKKEQAPQPVNPPSGPGTGDVLPPATTAPQPAENAPSPSNPAQGNPDDF